MPLVSAQTSAIHQDEEAKRQTALASHGSVSPLATLVPEVLAQIFFFVPTKRPGASVLWDVTELTNLGLVCRYWHSVTLTPILWRDVVVGDTIPQAQTQAMIERSGALPIRIGAAIRHKSECTAMYSLLEPYVHRVEELIFDLLTTDDCVLPRGDLNIPNLRFLEVTSYAKATIPLVSARHPLPHLSELHIMNVVYNDVASMIRPTLTRLNLCIMFNYSTPSAYPMPEFLTILQSLPALQDLHCASMFFSNSFDELQAGHAPQVTLSQLRILYIIDHRAAVANLLNHIIIPVDFFRTRWNFHYDEPGMLVETEVSLDSLGRGQRGLEQLFAAYASKLCGQGLIGAMPPTDGLLLEFGRVMGMEFSVYHRTEKNSQWATYHKVRRAALALDALVKVDPTFLESLRELTVRTARYENLVELNIHDSGLLPFLSWERDTSCPKNLTALSVNLVNLESLVLDRSYGVFEAIFMQHQNTLNYSDNILAEDEGEEDDEELEFGELDEDEQDDDWQNEEEEMDEDMPLLFPKLRSLTLIHHMFRKNPRYSPMSQDLTENMWRLKFILETRQDAKHPLEVLRIVQAYRFRAEDVKILEENTEVQWDGDTTYADK
ncbi:hypothetical protein EIP91_010881 [Steccherinum ochraceum]|uniref:F-box domain-containing protein n=1 Tax=Steccherinum ochraceum TaxID=92696 RepID=A0A4R0RMH2_9APHY|nr:hypothetical protein EIP91_010881 [Steccherinum ochraceum]